MPESSKTERNERTITRAERNHQMVSQLIGSKTFIGGPEYFQQVVPELLKSDHLGTIFDPDNYPDFLAYVTKAVGKPRFDRICEIARTGQCLQIEGKAAEQALKVSYDGPGRPSLFPWAQAGTYSEWAEPRLYDVEQVSGADLIRSHIERNYAHVPNAEIFLKPENLLQLGTLLDDSFILKHKSHCDRILDHVVNSENAATHISSDKIPALAESLAKKPPSVRTDFIIKFFDDGMLPGERNAAAKAEKRKAIGELREMIKVACKETRNSTFFRNNIHALHGLLSSFPDKDSKQAALSELARGLPECLTRIFGPNTNQYRALIDLADRTEDKLEAVTEMALSSVEKKLTRMFPGKFEPEQETLKGRHHFTIRVPQHEVSIKRGLDPIKRDDLPDAADTILKS